MAETDPKVMVCDWKCVSRGLATPKTLRKHICLSRQGYTGVKVAVLCLKPDWRHKSDVSASVQNPCYLSHAVCE